MTHSIYRLLILDVATFVGLTWAYQKGFVTAVTEGDATGISVGIGLTFVLAKGFAWMESIRLAKGDRPKSHELDYLFDMPPLLQTMGLFGTVVGLLVALNGVSVGGDISATITQMLSGLSTAFYTTAVGIVGSEILRVHIRQINTSAEGE